MSSEKYISHSSRQPSTPIDHTVPKPAASVKAGQNSSLLTSSKRRKYCSSPDWDSQITLTQLVPKTESDPRTRGLELVEYEDDGRGRKAPDVIDLVDDGDGNDESWRPSNRRTTRNKSGMSSMHSPNSIPVTTFKSRKSSVLIGGGPKPSRISKGKQNKATGRRTVSGNRTLTQMDFVRRFIPLPDSDDDNLNSYEGKLPLDLTEGVDIKKSSIAEKVEEDTLTPRKRRKLDNGRASASPTLKNGISPEDLKSKCVSNNLVPPPVTPQKKERFEIPSSQTPESPEKNILLTPVTQPVRRLDLQPLLSNATESGPYNHGESATAEKSHKFGSQTQSDNCLDADNSIDELENSTIDTDSHPPAGGTNADTKDPVMLAERDTQSPDTRSAGPLQKRTIIYDTDDTEYSDLDDDDDDLPEIPREGKPQRNNFIEQINLPSENQCSYSDDLPPIANSGTDLEASGNFFSDTALPSESSVYYRRPARYTQFPNEPIPNMNTQKIAELFPVIEEDADEFHATKFTLSASDLPAASSGRDQFDTTDQETAIPTQTDSDNREIQLIPESSPVTRSYENRAVPEMAAPSAREPVVLVESSQLVDKLNRQNSSINAGYSLRKLFSSRDFLTDSMMESIPAPPWMASQDSVGEPYSERDGQDSTKCG